MAENWTKGNWRVVDEYLEINQLPRTAIMAFEDGVQKNICRLSLRSPEEELANAHLLAAAPKMHKALEAFSSAITDYLEDLSGGKLDPSCIPLSRLNDADKLMRQALAEVKGGSQ